MFENTKNIDPNENGYYCEVGVGTFFFEALYPNHHVHFCNTYNGETKEFEEINDDTPYECDRQCNYNQAHYTESLGIYTSIHPCNPHLCEENQMEKEEIDPSIELYDGDYIIT